MFHRQSSAATIESHLRAIQSELARMGRNAGQQAADGAHNIGDQLGAAVDGILQEVAQRYRNGRRLTSDGAQRLGDEAIRVGGRLGHDALDGLTTGIERYPLATLGVAIAVGVLIGSAGRRQSK
jgi:ElaB/YqjD/DUF883 family membrane-anchored ribosome-binding protein